MIRRRAGLMLLAGMLAVGPSPAHAHQLRLFAELRGRTLFITARFSSGKPLAKGMVLIKDAAGALLAEVAVQADGTASLPLPDGWEQGLSLEVDAGGGHDAWWLMTPQDLRKGLEQGS